LKTIFKAKTAVISEKIVKNGENTSFFIHLSSFFAL